MWHLRPRPQPTNPESAFSQNPQWSVCTLKFEPHCSRASPMPHLLAANMAPGFMEEMTFGKNQSTSSGSDKRIRWLGFETGPGVALIQTIFTFTPFPHPGCEGEGYIVAHKAFYKLGQWGVDCKGFSLIQCCQWK